MPSRVTENARPIPILTYHQIAPAPPRGAVFRGLYVAPASFARQMAMLNWLGYRALSMSALMPYLLGQCQGKVVGITFDDGYLNNLTHALPVLQRHGFSATCYAVSQRLGQTNLWDQSLGVAQTPLMDAAQVRQWVSQGQELGAHTRYHADLTDSPAHASADELSGCKAELEGVIGAPVRHFCYPYGRYAPEHAQMAGAAGFDSATTTRRGRCLSGAALMQLPRVPVLRTTTLLTLWLKLSTGYEDRRGA